MPKIEPAMGVPKTVAKPALIPQTTILRWSRRRSRRAEAIVEASAAPICAHGPSLPTDPPTAIVSTVATSLIGATFGAIRPQRRWTASMTFSVPCPAASGASTCTSTAAASRPGGRSQRLYGRRLTASAVHVSDARKAAVEAPTSTPTPAARAVHLTTLAKSVVSSRRRRRRWAVSVGTRIHPNTFRRPHRAPGLG
jgi:hypothetical protein